MYKKFRLFIRNKIRMACETNKEKAPEVVMSKGQIRIGMILVITNDILYELSNI